MIRSFLQSGTRNCFKVKRNYANISQNSPVQHNLMPKSELVAHLDIAQDTLKSLFLNKASIAGFGSPQIVTNWIGPLLDYNVPIDKMFRGLAAVHAYQYLNPRASKENLEKICKLAWAIELIESSFFLADDIMDASITRKGRLCWYKKSDIGFNAINDTFVLEHAADFLLHDAMTDSPCYMEIMNVFNAAKFMTTLGQHMDCQPMDMKLCTNERYFDITKGKTGYHDYYLPVFTALRMSPQYGKEHDEEIHNICLKLGYYYQCQDDYLDCFGDPNVTGKIGTDIEGARYTWLLVEALQIVDSHQRKILEDNYGKQDELSVAKVKQLYQSIGLKERYEKLEQDECKKLSNMIDDLPVVELIPFFTDLLDALRGRRK